MSAFWLLGVLVVFSALIFLDARVNRRHRMKALALLEQHERLEVKMALHLARGEKLRSEIEKAFYVRAFLIATYEVATGDYG